METGEMGVSSGAFGQKDARFENLRPEQKEYNRRCCCESGGIGRRARLRIWSRKGWGFESPLSHHKVKDLTENATVSTEGSGESKASGIV